MKTTLYTPLMNSSMTEKTRPRYAMQLREAGADFVWIALDRFSFFLDDRGAVMQQLAENLAYLGEQGFACGVWMQAFGFGNPLSRAEQEKTAHFTKLRSLLGNTCGDAFCPEDPAFMERYLGWIADVAGCNPGRIMLDDDLCQSVRPGLGCICEHHRNLLAACLADRGLVPLSGDEAAWRERFFAGQGGADRAAFLDVMGDSLRRFCHAVRACVDGVDRTIRVGFCAGYTSWDLEGADAAELSHILAGPDTKPFLRLTAAPYWVTKDTHRFSGQRLNTLIEMARAQKKWCREVGGDIEIFMEADSYPRPRYHVPAAYLECFDAACRASGGMGTLKYLFDYYQDPDNETGYAKRHIRNAKLYETIEDVFAGKQAQGVYVYEPMRKAAQMTYPTPFAGEGAVMESAFSPAASMLSALSIPTAYDLPDGGTPECGIAFGDCAASIGTLPAKLILDLGAARYLSAHGVDVGLRGTSPTTDLPGYERYTHLENAGMFNPGHSSLQFQWAPQYEVCQLDAGAQVLSVFEGMESVYPSAYRYVSGGTEFYVLCVDAYRLRPNCSVFLSYGRQRQLLDFIGAVPHIAGMPGVYTMWKTGDGASALLIVNLCEDAVFDCEIALDRSYRSLAMYGTAGVLDGTVIRLTGEIAPFGVAVAVLTE